MPIQCLGHLKGQRGRLTLYLLHMVDNGSLGSFYHIVAPRRGMRGTVASVQNIYIYVGSRTLMAKRANLVGFSFDATHPMAPNLILS